MAAANTLYTPALPQTIEDPEALRQYHYRELIRIAVAFEQIRFNTQLDVLHVAPAKPQNGLIVYADGTNWNPGSGVGFYGYENGAWVKL